MTNIFRCLTVCAFAVALAPSVHSQESQTLPIAPDSPRWDLQQEAKVTDYLGRKCLMINGGGSRRRQERPLTKPESDAIQWQEVESEPPGIVALYHYRRAPHPVVTFPGDFSKRHDPQPGMKVLYARTTVNSDRDQIKKLEIGYSDDVSVFLNGKILYRGPSAQGFRDPGFLGVSNPENDAVYVPLHKVATKLMLAVSELGRGWASSAAYGDGTQ